MRIELQPAFVLHSRPYRDTSLLVDFFTLEHGRISAVARGVRQRKTRTRSLLNPFSRLLVSFQGKSDLKLMTAVESDNLFFDLRGEQLYCGFYLNELLMRVLAEMDPHPDLFQTYQQGLQALQSGADLEPLLRCFELDLLAELGYGVDFGRDALTDDVIQPDGYYSFDAQQGFSLVSPVDVSSNSAAARFFMPGKIIDSIARRDFSESSTRISAKQLCRQMLKPLLGNRPLKSRELFVSNH